MTGRSVYIVAYDVGNPARLRRVYKKMRGYGDALQYSVFRCHLSAKERELLITGLCEIIVESEDRVMIVDLGPVGGAKDGRVRFLGRPIDRLDDGPVVF